LEHTNLHPKTEVITEQTLFLSGEGFGFEVVMLVEAVDGLIVVVDVFGCDTPQRFLQFASSP